MTTDRPLRILLVDDEADLIDFLSQRLLKRGWTVTATTDGEEALAAVRRQPFDVAVVDLRMPRMDGIELLERIHAEKPYLAAIMLTGHGSTESALEAGRLGVVHYLIKPYDSDELIARIEEAALERESQLEAAYQEEMTRTIQPGATPTEILEHGEELRRKYERD